ncbi:GNAT family N-acetyltransferase [Streptomyces sp. NPDC057638]|uniref:GNAT family N-acetyltransferase n=1 Tax=Streptomyces sp. NPDC057638 TaxID=3346190 RepID=UPI0036B2AE59
MTVETEEVTPGLRSGRMVTISYSSEADYEIFVRWFTPDSRIASLTGDAGEQVTVAALREDAASGSQHCTIRTLDGRPVGMVKFRRAGGIRSTMFEISGAIGIEGLWSRGYGAEGFGLVIQHLFEDLAAHRLEFRVGLFNRPMLEMVMRLKFFVLEGVLRDRMPFGGEFYDLTVWSMLRAEYESLFLKGHWEEGSAKDVQHARMSPEKAESRRALDGYLRNGLVSSLSLMGT